MLISDLPLLLMYIYMLLILYHFLPLCGCGLLGLVVRKIGKDDFDDFIAEEVPEGEEAVSSDPTAAPPAMSAMEQKVREDQTNMIVAHFFFAIIWSVGATLDASSRLKFDEFFKTLCEMESNSAKHPR